MLWVHIGVLQRHAGRSGCKGFTWFILESRQTLFEMFLPEYSGARAYFSAGLWATVNPAIRVWGLLGFELDYRRMGLGVWEVFGVKGLGAWIYGA